MKLNNTNYAGGQPLGGLIPIVLSERSVSYSSLPVMAK